MSARKKKWADLLDDLEYVLIFVIKDTVTLALLVLALKAGELIMSLFFTEQHPFVQYVRQFTWLPFIFLYAVLIVSDLVGFLRRGAKKP